MRGAERGRQQAERVEFAARVARDAPTVTAKDVEGLRALGMTESDIVDVALAASARAFFTKVLDALGVQADFQLGETFDSDVRGQVTVGRPIADRAAP